MKRCLTIVIMMMLVLAIPLMAGTRRSADQVLSAVQSDDTRSLRVSFVDLQAPTDFAYLTNFGTGDQLIAPAENEKAFSVEKDTSDSTLAITATDYTFANDTTDINYFISGDVTLSFKNNVYTAKYIGSTLYYIKAVEDSGKIDISFYNSSYAKVAVPSLYTLGIAFTFFGD